MKLAHGKSALQYAVQNTCCAPSLPKCEMSWKWEGPAQLKICGFETHSPTVKPIVLPAKRKLILLKILGLLIKRTSRFETHCPPNETHSPPNANSLSSKRRGYCYQKWRLLNKWGEWVCVSRTMGLATEEIAFPDEMSSSPKFCVF